MWRPVMRLALILVIGTVSPLLVIAARRYDPAPTEAFFAERCEAPPAASASVPVAASVSDDAAPCWQGIRPGETSADDALALLNAHPWVDTVDELFGSPYAGGQPTTLIRWTWSDRYPFTEDALALQQGILVTDRGIVRQIYLTTGIAFGDLWLALGGADGGAVDYSFDSRYVRVDNTALFWRAGIAATASYRSDCSVTYPNFWQTPVSLWMQEPATLSIDDVAYPVYLRVMRTGYRRVWATFC